MILTGDLKDKVASANSIKEKKKIIADAGMELTDEELENVAGGTGFLPGFDEGIVPPIYDLV